MPTLKVGFAKTVITPAIGFGDMYGYAARKECNRAPRGVLDEQYAKALVVDDGRTQAALVALDVGNIDVEFTAQVREQAAKRIELPMEHIMVSGTHTHANVGITVDSPFPIDAHFREDAIRKATGAVCQAWWNRKPACIGSGHGSVPKDIAPEAYAHREKDPFSWGYEAQRSDAIMANKVFRGEPTFPLSDINKDTDYGTTPVDPEVGVIRVDHGDGRPMGVLYNFGCHPDVLGPNNVLLSADFPGYASKIIERELGEGSVAHFCQGADGDIRMVLTCKRSDWATAETDRDWAVHDNLKRMGGILAHEALKTWAGLDMSADVCVSVRRESILAPWWRFPDMAEVRRYKETQERDLQRALAGKALTPYPSKGTNYDVNIARMRLNWANRMLNEIPSGKLNPKGFMMEIQSIRIGQTVIIGIPAEVFALTSLKLKQSLPGWNVIVCGHANGCRGYLLPRGCHQEGGYWLESSPQGYQMPSYASPEGEELVRETAVKLTLS